MADLEVVVRRSTAVERCFGCKNLYSLDQLVPREGLLLCRRRCAVSHQVHEIGGAVIEVIG